MITSIIDDKAALGFRNAAALAMFGVISEALLGFFNTLVANLLPALAVKFPKLFKKLPSPSACIVLSLAVKDIFAITY